MRVNSTLLLKCQIRPPPPTTRIRAGPGEGEGEGGPEGVEGQAGSRAGGGRVMLLGGGAFATRRHVWWNFVSSSRDRINQAKEDWRSGQFPKVPGDEAEFIPIPDQPKTVSYP